jgi:hypothetical protein
MDPEGARRTDDVADDVLDALAAGSEDGLTVFELRTHVDADIDAIERALADLKQTDRIVVDDDGDRTTIHPAEGADRDPTDGGTFLDRVRDVL